MYAISFTDIVNIVKVHVFPQYNDSVHCVVLLRIPYFLLYLQIGFVSLKLYLF